MIQAKIGHDAIHPSIERTFKAKTGQIDVRPQKRFLVNVLAIFLRSGNMHCQPQHGAIILPHQFLEGCGVALLRCANQLEVVIRAMTLDAAFALWHEGQVRDT